MSCNAFLPIDACNEKQNVGVTCVTGKRVVLEHGDLNKEGNGLWRFMVQWM